jgi:hypothetical protein
MSIDPEQAPYERVDDGPQEWSTALPKEPVAGAESESLGISGHCYLLQILQEILSFVLEGIGVR